MLVGLRVHVRPAGGTEEVRVTVPVKPLRDPIALVEVTRASAFAVTLAGEAVKLKSWTMNVTVAV